MTSLASAAAWAQAPNEDVPSEPGLAPPGIAPPAPSPPPTPPPPPPGMVAVPDDGSPRPRREPPPAETPPTKEAPAPEPAPSRSPPRQQRTGLAVEVRLGAQAVVVAVGDTNTPVTSAVLHGGFFAGYKWRRLIVGLGLDLTHASIATSTGDPSGMFSSSDSTDVTTLIFSPGMQLALLRSRDERVELFGEVALLAGHVFQSHTTSSGPSSSGTDVSNYVLGYEIGPGIRYWFHPQFALGALVGLRGTWEVVTQTDNASGFTQTDTLNVTEVFADLRLIAVF